MKQLKYLIILCLPALLLQCTLDQLHENQVFVGDIPRAEFSFPNNQKPCARDCEVQFTNSSINAVVYEWDFGDGNKSMAENPLHVYNNPGTYTVKLKAINQNATNEFSQEIQIDQAITFAKNFGGDNYDSGEEAFQLNDNTCILLGYVESKISPDINQSTDYQIYFIHTDENGNLLDQRGFGTEEGGCSFEGGAEMNFGDLVIAGFDDEPWVFRTDPTGASMNWENRNPTGIRNWEDILIHPGGNIFIAGKGDNTSLYLSSVASTNGKMTPKNYPTLSGYNVSMTVAKDGSLLVVGHVGSFNGDLDPVLMKFDLSLNFLWKKENFGGSSVDLIRNVEVDSDGNIFMVGYSTSFTNGGYDILVIKADENGNLIEQTNFGSAKDDVGFDLDITDEGDVIIAGRAENLTNDSRDGYLLKLNNQLEKRWDLFFGGEESEAFNAISLTLDGGFLIAGETFGSSGTKDAWLIKTDSEGRVAE